MNPLALLGIGALKNLRGLKTVLIAGAAILLVALGLAIWAGVAAIGWLSNQVPVAKEALIAKVPEVRQQIEGVAPGISQGVEKFLSGETAMSDVPGEDPGNVSRYEGFVRTRYAVQDTSRAALFEGRAAFRPVSEHYQARFKARGWPHRVLFAAANEERHEYQAQNLRYELHLKQQNRSVSVEITEFSSTPRTDGATGSNTQD